VFINIREDPATSIFRAKCRQQEVTKMLDKPASASITAKWRQHLNFWPNIAMATKSGRMKCVTRRTDGRNDKLVQAFHC
jgi:hypothetical protein